MFKVKLTCLDIILFSGFAYAISDSIKNWTDYKNCIMPLHVWLTTSVCCLLLIRILHFLGQVVSGIQETVENQDEMHDPEDGQRR